MNSDTYSRKIMCDIARTAFRCVGQLLDDDQNFASQLRTDTTGSRQFVREESLTERMASELVKHYSHHVDIRLFSPHEERQTGADWYWRIERGKQAIHARVQAKRVQRTEYGQPDEEGRVDIDRQQLRQLIQESKSASEQLPGLQAWLATYLRFRASPPCGREDLDRCPRHSHGARCYVDEPSLWIAQASEILDCSKNQLTPLEVVQNSVRLDCVLPCIQAAGDNSGPAVKGLVLLSDLPSYSDCINAIQNDPKLDRSFRGALRIYV